MLALQRHAPIIIAPVILRRGPGRPAFNDERMSQREYRKRAVAQKKIERLENIAVLDMETEPFDNTRDASLVFPFLAVLYGDKFETVVIWDEERDSFIDRLIAAIEGLPGRHTIYAHNGGKFDFMFLVKRLRGRVAFKGRALMCARIGDHELRDSYHIIPEKLASWQKDAFDYVKNRKHERHKWRDEIIRYCINDCRYLLQIVKDFLSEFGFKISIGQAAQAKLRESYKVQNMGEQSDAFLRNYFFGGRVECLAGRGAFASRNRRVGYSLFDVNSMYPYVMACARHPVGNSFTVRRGAPKPGQTVFMELTCRNYGALVRRGDDGETSAEYPDGLFRTTIWEYQTALKYNLIENVKINWCIDFAETSDFSKFVLPLYERRQLNKINMRSLQPNSPEWFNAKKDDIFLKLILNNAYGKFAQNPRNYKEAYITDPEEEPPFIRNKPGISDELPWGDKPRFECKDYWIWERPQPFLRFRNVATAASITGAARAKLLEAIQLANDPIYCDTDSLVCRGFSNVELDATALGAWKQECAIDDILIAGKKLYAYTVAGLADGHPDRIKVRSKGVAGATWRDVERALNDEVVPLLQPAPTMTRKGDQFYMRREIRATAPVGPRAIVRQRNRERA